MHGFSQRLPVDWLREHLAAEATHYLFPTLVQRLTHRPETPLQWRCQKLLTVNTGEQIWGLLNVLPDTFDKIPETLGHGVQEGHPQPHRASSEGA
ncbi:hypothetical protein QFZ32_004253 [Streptomyces canus]|nr:hypothetical protein [Streptomyces canus]